jgi:hypothetical protein
MNDRNVRKITDWGCQYDGVTLVFENGESVRVTRAFKDSYGTWKVQGGRTSLTLRNESELLVGPTGIKEPNIRVTAFVDELASTTDVKYELSSDNSHLEFKLVIFEDSDLKFAVLPTLLYEILQSRTRGSNDAKQLLRSGRKWVFVAASLLEDWLQSHWNTFRHRKVDDTDAYMGEGLRQIAATINHLQTPAGLLAAARHIHDSRRPKVG